MPFYLVEKRITIFYLVEIHSYFLPRPGHRGRYDLLLESLQEDQRIVLRGALIINASIGSVLLVPTLVIQGKMSDAEL